MLTGLPVYANMPLLTCSPIFSDVELARGITVHVCMASGVGEVLHLQHMCISGSPLVKYRI
jgi:hypothetical protein